ncbi:MAG: hypothetical protein GZ087_11125 [Flavobacterium sp.]|nr:hypothetical protein [Flavobacterium sp.]
MKKYIISFVFTLLIAALMQAQKSPGYIPLATFNKDTLQYLISNFDNQKAKYIGKPIGMVFNDIELEIKRELRLNQSPRNKKYFAGVILDFYNVALNQTYSLEKRRRLNEEMKNYGLYIETVQAINSVDYYALSRQEYINNGNSSVDWSNNYKAFYTHFIVKSIKTNATP